MGRPRRAHCHEMTVCRREPCDGRLTFSNPVLGRAHDCLDGLKDGGGCGGSEELCTGAGRGDGTADDLVLRLSSE